MCLSCHTRSFSFSTHLEPNIAGLPYPWVSNHRFDQLQVENIQGEKILESSKKQNLNLPHSDNCLHSIYIVLGVTVNLEVIESVREDVPRLYANMTPFHIGGLERPWIWVLEPIPCGYRGRAEHQVQWRESLWNARNSLFCGTDNSRKKKKKRKRCL